MQGVQGVRDAGLGVRVLGCSSRPKIRDYWGSTPPAVICCADCLRIQFGHIVTFRRAPALNP